MDIDIKKYSKEDVEKVSDAIKNGKCVIVPTDTVYGIAALAENEEAVYKIYDIKKRSLDKPINILVSNIEMIRSVTKSLSKEEEKIINEFFPRRAYNDI